MIETRRYKVAMLTYVCHWCGRRIYAGLNYTEVEVHDKYGTHTRRECGRCDEYLWEMRQDIPTYDNDKDEGVRFDHWMAESHPEVWDQWMREWEAGLRGYSLLSRQARP